MDKFRSWSPPFIPLFQSTLIGSLISVEAADNLAPFGAKGTPGYLQPSHKSPLIRDKLIVPCEKWEK